MIRTTTLPAVALLAAALLVPTAAAAAGETCQGRAATLVGQPRQVDLLGTEGPDVIVSNGAQQVQSLGGDDLVCVTGERYTIVRAGAGDDVVDATTVTPGSRGVAATLGDGDDTYLGSAADDEVITGLDTESDSGSDVVDTGAAGDDLVFSGEQGLPNPDRVTGDGVEIWWRGVPTAAGLVDGGGAGTFRYYRPRDVSRVRVDARAGTLSTDIGSSLALSGFTSFAVDGDRDLRAVEFLGSTRDETLHTFGSGPRTAVRATMGGGDDRVSVGDLAPRSRLRGGRGSDRVLVGSRSAVELSLATGRLRISAGRRATTTRADGFEHAAVTSPDVVLTGTGRANDLEVNACHATVSGRGGRDVIRSRAGTLDTGRGRCPDGRRSVRLEGGAAHDVLVGSAGPDRLVGGPGRDRADGKAGRDTCLAETVRRCEARR